jgi:hypothetical protein
VYSKISGTRGTECNFCFINTSSETPFHRGEYIIFINESTCVFVVSFGPCKRKVRTELILSGGSLSISSAIIPLQGSFATILLLDTIGLKFQSEESS